MISCASAQTRREQEQDQEKPVAVVSGEPIYSSEFVPKIEGQIYKVRLQEYELKRKALEGVINQQLLTEEAEVWGITPEELLRQEADDTIPDPTDEQVEQRFVMYMFQAGGASGVTKDQVRQQMKQAAIEEARQRYFLTLRQTADVNIYLLPPALDVDYDPARVRGYPDAPITIVEFSDFQCPYCEQAYFMVKTLQERYAGKVKLAYRDLPLQEVQNEYRGAAVASRCAGEQDKFWEYHDILFEHQEEYGERYFVQFAETLGLDVDKFTACLNSDKFFLFLY
jgi:protein-disulfide isomerase